MIALKIAFRTVLLASVCLLVVVTLVQSAPVNAQGGGGWQLIWSDEFTGAAGTGVNTNNWLYDIGTCYPGCPTPNWGTGEVETMTASTNNVYQDGAGHLIIKPILSGSTWTSGRIETQRTNFAAPTGGILAVEASIQQPNVSGAAAAGYWPAFWMLGAPFRGVYTNWPSIGEIDVMEDVNGLSSLFGTLHCGTAPNGPCNEYTGIGSGQRACSGCQTGLRTYRMEYDRSVSPEEIRWYLDGVNYFTVHANQVDATTWNNALHHGFFIIFDVAMGGGFPAAFGGGPTASTASGVPLVVDYVRVYTQGGPSPDTIGLYTQSSAQFYLRNSNSAGAADFIFSYGATSNTWRPLAGDWTGQGKTTIGLYDPATGTFYLRNSNSAGATDLTFQYGPANAGMIPIVGDWMSQGKKTIGLYSPSSGYFYLHNSNSAGGTGSDIVFAYGPPNAGLMPIVGDWMNQGYDSVGLYNQANAFFYLHNCNAATCGSSDTIFQYGPATSNGGAPATPLLGRWVSGNNSTIGVYVPANAYWYLKNTNAAGNADTQFQYGPGPNAGWLAVIGHWGTPGTIEMPPEAISVSPRRISGIVGRLTEDQAQNGLR